MAFFSAHKILIAVIVIVILGVGWYGLYGTSGESPVLVSGSTSTGPDPGQDVVRTLTQMHAISLSAAILSDQAFQGLKDFSTQIIPEPVGRLNPFAPFGASAPSGAAATTSAHGVRLYGSQQP